MKKFAEEVLDIIKDELYEIKYMNIRFKLKEFNSDTKNDHPHGSSIGMCMTFKDAKKFDENGIQLNRYVITLAVNGFHIREFYKKSKSVEMIQARFEEYLNNIGIKFNEKTLFIVTALHEIGHAVTMEEFRYFGLVDGYKTYNKINQGMTNFALTRRKLDDHKTITNIDLIYKLNPSELNADNFVFIKFPRIWDKVKHLVLND